MKKGLFRLQYELPQGADGYGLGGVNGAHLDIDQIADDEVRQCLAMAMQPDARRVLLQLLALPQTPCIATAPLTCYTPEALAYRIAERQPKALFLTRPLQTINQLDDYLYTASYAVAQGAYLWCHCQTSALKRALIAQQYPWGVSALVSAADYVWHRLCPKLWLTHGIYFAITQGKNRTLSRVGVLGRVCRAGFVVVDERMCNGELFVVARKVSPPVDDAPPTGSPIIHLRRIGKGGNQIVVHKFRTMYTYSEYIQQYVGQHQGLAQGGKFKNDYRVNFWGKLLRRTWLDELPMLWNLLRGDIKLVGVRPLSRHYYSLYTPEMQQLRIKVKPGLLPPFYYERHTPETIDEVQASERRYIEAYMQAPFATDWRYFWGIVANIVLRRKHSA